MLLARSTGHLCTGSHSRRPAARSQHTPLDPDLVPLQQVLDQADVLIVATPHPEYASIVTVKPIADVWNIIGRDG